MTKVATLWKEQEDKVRENGKQITAQLRQFAQEGTIADGDGEDGLEFDVIEQAYDHYKARFDSKYGGFGAAPKFPTPVHLRALLRFGAHDQVVRDIVGDKEVAHARAMAVKTLECMAKGGIKDQIGHGFARYSVTRDWSLPHFEKMLYDNAQLLSLYLDAWLLTKKELFLETAHDIATYLTSTPMRSELGGIHASENADSAPSAIDHHKREGAFYVFSYDEFKQILDTDELKVAAKYYNVKPGGNVDGRYDQQGELAGKNTLCVVYDIVDLATELSMPEDKVKALIASSKRKLLEYRDANRPRPSLDDKIVTSWNGMAIGALVRAGSALGASSPDKAREYLQGAVRAVNCIRDNVYDSQTHTLRRIYREGPGDTQGFADDYAFLIAGLVDVYEATYDDSYLSFADNLQKRQIELFWDSKGAGGFFSTPENQPDILVRTKDGMDSAEPSTNGVSASNLFRLGSLLNDEDYERKAKRTVSAFEVEIGQHPGLFTGMMANVVAAKLGMKSLMIIGDGELSQKAVAKFKEKLRPNWTVLRVGMDGAKDDWVKKRNGLLKDVPAGKELVQICEGRTCRFVEMKDMDTAFDGNTQV